MFKATEQIRRFFGWLEEKPLARIGWIIGVLVVAAYAAMPAEELTFDSAFIIGMDSRLRVFSMESVELIFRQDYWWPTLTSNLYRPLTTLSFWFEYSFLGFEENPLGYQLVNLGLHFAACLLMVRVALRLGLSVPLAFGATLVFAVHPIGTEVVANIVGRSDLLATVALCGALLGYLKALEQGVRSKRNLLFAGSGLCAFLGVMSKESAIVIPAIIALHGLLRMGELKQPDTARCWWQDAVAVAVVMLPAAGFFLFGRILIGGAPGVADHPFIDNPLMPEGFWVSRLGALGVWAMQIYSLFSPFRLSSDYSFDVIPVPRFDPINETAWWGLGCLAAILVGLVIFGFHSRRFSCRGVFLSLAYVVGMLPTSNLIIKIGSIRADRFHYLPSLFFWIGVAGLAGLAWRRLEQEGGNRALRNAGGAVFAWMTCLLVITHLRCYDWRNNLTIWSSALANAPRSVKAASAVANETVRLNKNVDTAHHALGVIVEALDAYDRANVADADRPLAMYSDYGAFSLTVDDALEKDPATKEEGRRQLVEALAWMKKGEAYEEAMRRRWANRWLDGNTKTAPLFVLLHRNYATILIRLERYDDALQQVQKVLDRYPLNDEAIELKAEAYRRAGRFEEASKELMMLSVIKPDSLAYVTALGDALAKVFPGSVPIMNNPSGQKRLNIDDPAVRKVFKEACLRYEHILLSEYDNRIKAARLRRAAKFSYGVDLGDRLD